MQHFVIPSSPTAATPALPPLPLEPHFFSEAGNHIYDQTAPEQVAAAAAGGPAFADPADWALPTPIYGGYGGQLVFFETMTPMVRTACCIHRKR